MNDVSSVVMQTPIEIVLGVDENGMTTARALYDFLELAPTQFARWAKQNIESNEYFEENTDWWGFDIVSSSNKCKDYRLTTDFAKHLSMESHSSKGKIARQYFISIEDKAKEMVINRSQLSQSTQALFGLIESMAKQELEQKRQAEQLKRIEQRQEVLSDTFTHTSNDDDFKAWVNRCIAKIAESPHYTNGTSRTARYQNVRTESYDRLRQKWNCNLNDRVARAKGRALDSKPDITKKELDSINKLTVICDDKSLKPIYETVIKEMMLCYCVTAS